MELSLVSKIIENTWYYSHIKHLKLPGDVKLIHFEITKLQYCRQTKKPLRSHSIYGQNFL